MFKEDEVFYKICFDSLLEGICITDEEGRIVMINSATEEIFGYTKEELVGHKVDMLVPKSLRKIYQEHYRTFVEIPRKYKKGRGLEFLGLHKNGKILDLEIGLTFFYHDDIFYAKALISEISTRRKKEQRIKEKNRYLEIEVEKQTTQLMHLISELESSNRQLKLEIKERVLAEKKAKNSLEKEKELNLLQTKFVSMASHEFKTPLSGILTSAGLIEKHNEKVHNENISHHSRTIKALVSQLNNILDDFLFLENTEGKNYAMRLSEFKFCDLINKLVKDADAILKDGQRIEIKPCESPIVVLQDRKVIDIIIRNVLYNAIKYSPKGSVITMKITKTAWLNIEIEDQGIGIPVEAQRHVFKRFFRAKNALPIQGTGIGLNIAKRYLEKLNGSIELHSEENVGTRVLIKLPLDHNKPETDKDPEGAKARIMN